MADPISAIANLAGSWLQAQAEKDIAKEQRAQDNLSLEEQKRQFRELQLLKEQQMKSGLGMAKRAESMLGASFGPGSVEEQYKQDILGGTQEALGAGASQMAAALAQQGMRGGQAATQLRRGIGEMATAGMRQMTEADLAKQNMMRQYQMQKALLGQQAQV
jgi:hypothetical protein